MAGTCLAAKMEEKEVKMSKESDYAYLVFMYGREFVDNVLLYIENSTDTRIKSPCAYLESMTEIADYVNRHNGTQYEVYIADSVLHYVCNDESGDYYHSERKKDEK